MMRDQIDLLPEDRARALRQAYFVRLAVVGVFLLSGVAIVHGVLLLPSYLYLNHQVRERTIELERLSQGLAGSEEQEVSARVKSLSESAAHLARLSTTPKASAAIAAVIEVPRSGIRLTGFSYAPAETGAKMTVTGIASTREALRAFEQALRTQPYVESADLPISAYAKESEIPFVITLTGSLLP